MLRLKLRAYRWLVLGSSDAGAPDWVLLKPGRALNPGDLPSNGYIRMQYMPGQVERLFDSPSATKMEEDLIMKK